ncbi:MAG: GFA family protein [Solirubrobacteraceae bacterium]
MTDAGFVPLAGGCGCGSVRFEITAPLVAAAYCHCTRCQHRTGAAAGASALVVTGSVEVTAGADALRAWAPGDGFEKVFCGDCGSAVFGRQPTTGEIAIVRLGAIDGDPGIRPSVRQFVAYAAPWEPIPDDGLPRFDERIAPGETYAH